MYHKLRLFIIRNVRSCHSGNLKWTEPKGYDTGIKIYNPITKSMVPIKLKNPDIAHWYTCGPTVYDSSHIGHASTYTRVDILQRILRKYFNVKLVTVMNITDIDDKIIKRSAEMKIPWSELSEKYEQEFWNDLEKLNVKSPDIKIRVSKSIHLIIAFIQRIVDLGYAYKGKDGSIYFRTKDFSNYGKLKNILIEENTGNADKENDMDFALWKAAKPLEPSWKSPWGNGRPGWHIECSTMASYLFGSCIDFHAGGLDLRFPHHENEEAQSCCYHETNQWVNYWIHTGQLNVTGQAEKMSKSLKNTIGIDELLKKYTSDQFRFLCLLTRYRSKIDFDDETMKIAKSVFEKFVTFISDADAYIAGIKPSTNFSASDLLTVKSNTEQNLVHLFKDDFNTPKAVENMLNLISISSKAINSRDQTETLMCSNVVIVQFIKDFVENFLINLGFGLNQKKLVYGDAETSNNSQKLIQDIVDTRNIIRQDAIQQKDQNLFKASDLIRKVLESNKIELKDHGKETSWKYKS